MPRRTEAQQDRFNDALERIERLEQQRVEADKRITKLEAEKKQAAKQVKQLKKENVQLRKQAKKAVVEKKGLTRRIKIATQAKPKYILPKAPPAKAIRIYRLVSTGKAIPKEKGIALRKTSEGRKKVTVKTRFIHKKTGKWLSAKQETAVREVRALKREAKRVYANPIRKKMIDTMVNNPIVINRIPRDVAERIVVVNTRRLKARNELIKRQIKGLRGVARMKKKLQIIADNPVHLYELCEEMWFGKNAASRHAEYERSFQP